MAVLFRVVVLLTYFLKVLHGQPENSYCDNMSDCTLRSIYGHVECVDNFCKCELGSVFSHNYCTYNLTALDTECTFNEDCVVPHSECYRNKSNPACHTDDPFIIDTCAQPIEKCLCTGNCACRSDYTNIDQMKCVPVVNLNDSCNYTKQCSHDGPGAAECLDEVCRCAFDTVEYSNKCYTRPGIACNDNSECLPHALCDENKICMCRESTYFEEGGKCERVKHYFEKCSKHNECGENLHCPDNKKVCVCATGFHYNEEIKYCIENRTLRQDCSFDYQCEWNGNKDNMICLHQNCSCRAHHVEAPDGKYCVKYIESDNKTKVLDSVDPVKAMDLNNANVTNQKIWSPFILVYFVLYLLLLLKI